MIEGRLKKKTLTTGQVDCAVVIAPNGQAATSGLSVQANQFDGEEVDTSFFAQTGKRAPGGPVKAKKWESLQVSTMVDKIRPDTVLSFELRFNRAAGAQGRRRGRGAFRAKEFVVTYLITDILSGKTEEVHRATTV